MYNGCAANPQWAYFANLSQTLPSETFHVACYLLEYANEGNVRNNLRGSVEGIDLEQVAYYTHVPLDKVKRIYTVFEEKQWIEAGCIASWDRFQFESDDVSERVRAHRENKKDKKRYSNVSETCRSVSVSVSDSVSLNKKREQEFLAFKEAYPPRDGAQGWKEARQRFYKIVSAGDATPEQLINAAKHYCSASAHKQGADRSGIQQAATFLGPRKETWREYLDWKPTVVGGTDPMLAEYKRKKGES